MARLRISPGLGKLVRALGTRLAQEATTDRGARQVAVFTHQAVDALEDGLEIEFEDRPRRQLPRTANPRRKR